MLRLAVCPGRVGLGAEVADAVFGEYLPKRLGAVAGAVVGQDPPDRRALCGIGGDHGLREAGAVCAALARPQLHVRESGVVIDSDVRIRPAGAVAAIDAILENPLADLPEASQLLISRWTRSPTAPYS